MEHIHTDIEGRSILELERKQRLVGTFVDLVTIASPTGEELEIGKYLLDTLLSKKIDAEIDARGNVFGQINGTGEPLLLAAHMDTVIPGTSIRPVVSRGEIKSDGSTIIGADNKSTIASIFEMIDRLKEDGIIHRPLDILFTVDEEAANTGAAKFDYSKLRAKKGIISDIAQPIGTIVLASPAYLRFDAALQGKAGHAAFPENATNVLKGLGQILEQTKLGYVDGLTTVNIGLVSAGTARNAIPGQATLQGEIRSYDDNDLRLHLERMIDLFNQIAHAHKLKLIISKKQDNPGYIFDKDDPYVKEVEEVLRMLKIKPRYIKSPSCSDANIFNSVPGLQVINIGDGTRRTHTVEESIKVLDMEKQIQIFSAFATRNLT